MKLSLQVFSDTHIERIDPTIIQSDSTWQKVATINSDIVVLAGDIGNPHQKNYWSFIDYVSRRCKIVLLTTGNHEYWGNKIEETDLLIRKKIKDYSNVRFLQRTFTIIDDTVFLGCTLWSYIPPEFSKPLEGWAGDFKSIEECKNVEIFNSWHFRDLEWLVNSIFSFRKQGFQVVVLTHYTPSIELNFNPAFDVSPTAFAFSSDLSILYPYVKAWIYGHTHFDYSNQHKYTIGDYQTLFMSNQRGYPDKVRRNYRPDFSVRLDNIKNSPEYKEEDKPKDFNIYNDKYVQRMQTKLEEWLKNGKRIKN